MTEPVLNVAGALAIALLVAGCGGRSSEGTLVLTQVPIQAAASPAKDWLQLAYPAGSRVVAVSDEGQGRVRVLSGALAAAGDPRLSSDGTRVLFSGRAGETAEWQIYEVPVRGGRPRQVTHASGGAMTPAWLPDGRIVYAAPVPSLAAPGAPGSAVAIYAQSLAGGAPERLSYGLGDATDLTVLSDGRILFVAAADVEATEGADGLFTINNDGTEVTAFAAVHDGAARLQRPRQLPDGRVVFLSGPVDGARRVDAVEQVSWARPFSSRRPLEGGLPRGVRSVEPGRDGGLLVALRPAETAGGAGSFGIYGLGPEGLGAAVFDDPEWDDVEASRCCAVMAPMGRLSTLDPGAGFGRVLCLDANDSVDAPEGGVEGPAVLVRIRVGDEGSGGRLIGEVPVQADGSFLAELPADVPIGLETVDAEGRVIRRLAPSFWLRPGENRACVGCHEPHNRSPRNVRPLAVKHPVVHLELSAPAGLTAIP